MIKVIHLTKIYKTGEVEVVALDNVLLKLKRENLWRLWDRLDQANPP